MVVGVELRAAAAGSKVGVVVVVQAKLASMLAESGSEKSLERRYTY